MNKHKLVEQCELTLTHNDLGEWTRPAPGLYPHQWLWDSCFIGIGIRHYDVKRAQTEIDSLFRGQWGNGMIPHMIFGPGDYYGDKLWKRTPESSMPKNQLTSGITQPPLISTAMVKIGEKMTKTKRQQWYKSRFNQLLEYHEWLYRERDPEQKGLVVLVHPWESGIDNSPSWMKVVHADGKPLWISAASQLGFTKLLENMRRDTHYVPAYERIDTIDALLLYHQLKKLAKYKYDSKKTLKQSKINVYDVLFNSILIRANQHLVDIANEIDAQIPYWLQERFKKSSKALESLWDTDSEHYYDHRYKHGSKISELTIGRYLPLYSGVISRIRADKLAKDLEAELNDVLYPVPSTPKTSKYFNARRYWQGPTWVNTNWLIIEGLENYGHVELARRIRNSTLQLVSMHGPHEYFNPIDGTPVGAHQFSWSAALAIDLAAQN